MVGRHLMPKKIAMIGAGSIVFCKTLMSDIMATPALAGQRVRPDEPHRAEAAPHGGLRPAHDRATTACRAGLGHARPPRGHPRRRLRRRDDPGRRRRRLRARLRDPAEVRRRSVHRRFARARAASSAACAPSRCWSTSRATWRSSPSPAPSCSSTPTRWPPTAWRSGKATERAVRRPLPRRADHARPDRRLLRRAQGRDHLHLRRHQPHGLVPARSSTTAATSTRSCARCSKSPSTTRTRRCAARSSATSATS